MSLYRLKLDHDRVFWGADPIDISVVAEGDVVLDHAPDNPPGRYRWDLDARALLPLPPSKVKSAPDAPTLEQALYWFLRDIEERGVQVPASARAWAAEFEKTVDLGNGGVSNYFRSITGGLK